MTMARTTTTQITAKMIWLVRMRRCSRVIFFFWLFLGIGNFLENGDVFPEAAVQTIALQ
jgi:hypothetical protein